MNENIQKHLVSFDDEPDFVQPLLAKLSEFGWEIVGPINDVQEFSCNLESLQAAIALVDLYWQDQVNEWQGFDHADELNSSNLSPAVVVYSQYSTVFAAARSVVYGAIDFLAKDGSSDEAEQYSFTSVFEFYNHRLEVALMRQMLRSKRHSLLLSNRQDSLNHLSNDLADWFGFSTTGRVTVSVLLDIPDEERNVIHFKDHCVHTERRESACGILYPNPGECKQISQETSSEYDRIVVPLFYNFHESALYLKIVGYLVIDCANQQTLTVWSKALLGEVADLIVDLLFTEPSGVRPH